MFKIKPDICHKTNGKNGQEQSNQSGKKIGSFHQMVLFPSVESSIEFESGASLA